MNIQMKINFLTYIQDLQDTIVAGLTVDGHANLKTMGTSEGGGGHTYVIENGTFFEGSINISSRSREAEAMQKMFGGVGEADFLPVD
jgi:coproporphyrinogen III oxidase